MDTFRFLSNLDTEPLLLPTLSPSPAPTPQPTLVSDTDVLWTVRTNAYIFGILFTVYCVLRCTPKLGFINNKVYTPRKWSSNSKPVTMPPRGLLAWMLPLLSSDADVRVLNEVGLDAFVFLRLLRLGLVFFVVSSVLGLTFLLPLYSTQAKYNAKAGSIHPSYLTVSSKQDTSILGLNEFTINSLTTSSEGRKYLWVAVLATWLYSAFFMFLLHQDYLLYIELRHRFLRTPHPQAYTVLVERIPSALNNRPALIHYFEKIFPGEVLNAEVVKENSKLETAVEQRERVLQRYERAILYHKQTGKRPVQINWGSCRKSGFLRHFFASKLGCCFSRLCCCFRRGKRSSKAKRNGLSHAAPRTASSRPDSHYPSRAVQRLTHRRTAPTSSSNDLNQPLLGEMQRSLSPPPLSSFSSRRDEPFVLLAEDNADDTRSHELGGFSLFSFLGRMGAKPAGESNASSTGGSPLVLDAELGVEEDEDESEDDDEDLEDDFELGLDDDGAQRLDVLGNDDDDATTFATAMSLRTSRTYHGVFGRFVVDSLDYYRDELNRLNLRIRVLQERAAKKRRVMENKGNRRVVQPSKLLIAQQLNHSRSRLHGPRHGTFLDENDRIPPPSPTLPSRQGEVRVVESDNLSSPSSFRRTERRKLESGSLARVSPSGADSSELRREDEEQLLVNEGLLNEITLDSSLQSSPDVSEFLGGQNSTSTQRESFLERSDRFASDRVRSSPDASGPVTHQRQQSSSSTLTQSSPQQLRPVLSDSDLLSLATVENESSVDSALPWGSSTIPVMDMLLRHTALDDFRKSSAFVTFNSLRATMCASQSVVDRPLKMRIAPAPDPRDVEWKNLGLSLRARITVTYTVNAAILVTTLLFGLLTSTLAAATNIQSLRAAFPDLDRWLKEEGHEGFEELLSQLPPLLLVILFALVPIILNFLLRLERPISKSSQETQFFSLYFNFLLVQVFLFYTIAGTIIAPIKEIIEKPGSILSHIGTSLPANDMFFMQYLAIRALSILPLELLRVVDVIIALLRPIFCGRSKTGRERRMSPCACHTIDHPGGPNYGKNSANYMLCLTIGLCYSVISPLNAVVAGIYFALSTVVYRHQLLFVYTHEHESGGHLWPLFFRSALIGLVIFQFTMLGIFAFNSMPAASSAMLPLVIFTIVFMVYCDTAYGQASRYLPLGDAAELDVLEEARSYAYQHPMYLAPSNAAPETMEEF